MTSRRRRPSDAEVEVRINDQFRPRTDRQFVRRVVETTLDFAGRTDLEVSILLTDNRGIRAIHRDYLDDASVTDVISFEIDNGVEMAVCVERARRIARERGHTIRAELALYLVHGLLHACGYDDVESGDRAAMRAAERTVLTVLNQRIESFE